MENNKTLTITVIVVFIAAIVIILYFLYFRGKEFPPEPPPIDPDPDTPPGYQTLEFDHIGSGFHYFTWNLNRTYEASLLSGNLRVGGALPTDIMIKVRSNGKWKHLGTVKGSPDNFKQFALKIDMEIDMVKWEAEQGILFGWPPYYIDEVHAQLMVKI